LCPIDARLIQHAMLTPTELLWINTYHRRVRETLADRVSADARRWLERVTDIV
jgi:Xaa-Pro aminopeptidase